MVNSKSQKLCLSRTIWSIRKFDRMIIEILVILLAISREVSTALGSSSNVTIRFQDVSCLVFRLLISLYVSEKKATSDPETTKEMISRKRITMARMVVACGLIRRNTGEKAEKSIFVKG
jgi:hypothetical protein